MSFTSLRDVVESELCAGCGICEAICGHDVVRMAPDGRGFLRPSVIAESPALWDEIRYVCPGIGIEKSGPERSTRFERLWGSIECAGIGYSSDAQVRWAASSGGALSTTLIYLLQRELVDSVVHVGPSRHDCLELQVHTSTSRQQVLANAGSRYAPTAPLSTLADLTSRNAARYAFVGKPCDVAALRAYGRVHAEYAERFTPLISFFCAGVPSMAATTDLINALAADTATLEAFRYRGCGWPGRATAIDSLGREFSMSYEESWGKILGPRIQFRCKICPDGIGEFADLVFGDAWHLENGMPSFVERPGRSLLLARTDLGRACLEGAIGDGYLVASNDLSFGDLELMQPTHKTRRQAVWPRLLAMRLARRRAPNYRGFGLARTALEAGPLFFARQFGGMLKRLPT